MLIFLCGDYKWCLQTFLLLQGLDLMSNLPFDLLLNSRDCEIKFGMHPFSMVARFNFISVRLYAVRLQRCF